MTEPLLDLQTPAGLIDALFNHGVSPAQMHGITGDHLEAVYALCHADLAERRFEQGLERAAFLAGHDPWDRRFHVVLGYALQQLGDYEAAGRAYTAALELDACDPLCALRLGECLGGLEDLDGAREMLEAAVKLSWLEPEHLAVRNEAQRYLDRLTGMGA